MEMLTRQEAMHLMGINSNQLSHAMSTGLLHGLPLPEPVYQGTRLYFYAVAVRDFVAEREAFERDWLSGAGIMEMLALTRGQFIHAFYRSGRLRGCEVPAPVVFSDRVVRWKKSDIEPLYECHCGTMKNATGQDF